MHRTLARGGREGGGGMTSIKVIEAPKLKKDWVGKTLLLKEHCKDGNLTPLPEMPLLITRRMNAREAMYNARGIINWGPAKILKCDWKCPTCSAIHTGYLPERWIEEGKAYFVELQDTYTGYLPESV